MPESWRDNDYQYRQQCEVLEAYVDGDLPSFKLLLVVTIPTAKIQADFDDLRFYDGAGNLLSHQVEYSTTVGDDYVVWVWVKKPYVYTSPSGTDNFVWAYYGYASATNAESGADVFGDYYGGVWHLKESGNGTAGEFVDSSGNGNHGTGGNGNSANCPDRATGKIGYGNDFVAASGDFIGPITATELDSWTVMVISLWFKSAATEGAYARLIEKGANSEWFIDWNQDGSSGGAISVYCGSNGAQPISGLKDENWHHLMATISATYYVRTYVDGVANNHGQGVAPANKTGAVNLGRYGGGGYTHNGMLDEVKISASADLLAMAPEWAKFHFRNVNEADHCLSWSAEEERPAAGGAISGSTALTFAVSGALAGSGALSGSATLAFSASAAIAGDGELAGAASLTFTPTAAIAAKGVLAGSSSLTFIPTGSIAGKGSLSGSSSLTFTPSAAFTATGILSGASNLTFSPSGSARGKGSLAGATTIDFPAAASLRLIGSLAGAASITFSPSAVIAGTGSLLGTATLIFTPTGLLTEAVGALSGSSSLSFTPSGSLHGTGFILGSATLTFTPSGILSRATSGPLRRGTEATESLPHRQSTTTTAVLRRPPSGTGGPLRRQN